MDKKTLISKAYEAFNKRDTESVLALMSNSVDWPKASEGGRAIGKDEIREYWSRQWQTFNPQVEVLEIEEISDTKAIVKVHQLVKDMTGSVLSDSQVYHEYTFNNGLIERMDIANGTSTEGKATAAFSKPS